jgi:very-short-patch-repair endonuclease
MHPTHQRLLGTEHLNEGLTWSGSRPFFGGKPLAAYAEGVQLLFRADGCTNTTHYRLMTPKAVSSGADMSCNYCVQPSTVATEEDMSRALQHAQLDAKTTWQYQPKWLPHGRVDFFMWENRVVVQVDGSAHTQGMSKARQPNGPVKQDLDFNLTAWQAGGKVVRVLYTDLDNHELLVQLQLVAGEGGRRAGPFLLLSPGFRELRFKDPGTQRHAPCIDWFRDAIKDSCTVMRSSGGWTLLLPPTL